MNTKSVEICHCRGIVRSTMLGIRIINYIEEVDFTYEEPMTSAAVSPCQTPEPSPQYGLRTDRRSVMSQRLKEVKEWVLRQDGLGVAQT